MKFDDSLYLADMYKDGYFPDFLVDKIKLLLSEVVALLESGERDIAVIQTAFDKAVISINDLEDEFEENGSEIETVARESIGQTAGDILRFFDIPIDAEDAIAEREW